MMTAKTRKIRSNDFDHADETTVRRTTGTVALDRLATPFNDNARETSAEILSLPQGDEPDSDTSVTGCAETSDVSALPRRRGPLVTRWIGFAARRRRIQARVNQMQDRQNQGRSEQQVH